MFAALTLLAGCKTWQVAPSTPQRLVDEQRPRTVRVTTSGGGTLTIRNPIVVADSIVAAGDPRLLPFATPRVGVATEDVRTLEVARFSGRRTLGLAAVIVTAAAAWAAIASRTAGGSLPPGGEEPKAPMSGAWSLLRIAWRISP